MNKLRRFLVCTLFISILFSILNVSYANNDLVNVNIINDLFDNIIQIANIIMVVLNFIFVIFVFYKEKNDNKKNEIKKYDEYWYNKFIIDNNIILLDNFFKELKELISKVCSDTKNRNNNAETIDILKYNQETFEKWTTMHNECKAKFCEKIDVVMPEFGSELRKDFSNLQDYVANKINELMLCQSNESINDIETEINDKLNEFKKNFIKKVYLKGKPKI